MVGVMMWLVTGFVDMVTVTRLNKATLVKCCLASRLKTAAAPTIPRSYKLQNISKDRVYYVMAEPSLSPVPNQMAEGDRVRLALCVLKLFRTLR